jgi:two-component system, sensor histidine kinase PdtaS
MKRLVSLLILLGCVHMAFCQEDPLAHLSEQQLMERLQQANEDSNRVNIQLSLGKSRLLNAPDPQKKDLSPLQLGQDALKLSEKIGYIRGQGNALLLIALFYNSRGHMDTGLALSQKALYLFQKADDKRGIAEADVIIGQHYGERTAERIDYYRAAYKQFMLAGAALRAATTLVDIADLLIANMKHVEASAPLHEALTIYQAAGYKDLQGVYKLLSIIAMQTSDFVTAAKYGILAIQTAEQTGDNTLQLCSIYCTTAGVYDMLYNHSTADSLFRKAMTIALRYNDSSYISVVAENWSICYRSAGKYKESIDVVRRYFVPMIRAIGAEDRVVAGTLYVRSYMGLNRYDLARQEMLEMRKQARLLDSTNPWAVTADRATAEYYEATGSYAAAYPLIQKVARFYERKRWAQRLAGAELLFYTADSATHRYFSAIGHLKRAQTINDSLLSISKTRQIEGLEIEYETEKKNRDLLLKDQNIQLLHKQAQLRESQLRESHTMLNMFVGGSVLLFVIVILGYSRYRVKQRSNLRLMMQQKEINNQNASLQKLLVDKNDLLQEKDGLLTEKNLLLREVHHRVKNNLHLVMSLLESQTAYLDGKPAQTAIAESQSRIQAIALIHQRLYGTESVSSVDMHLYIPELIDYLVDSNGVRQRGIEVRHSIERIKLDVSQSIPVGIILNEGITNAIKYAFPGKRKGTIFIHLRRVPDRQILLEIIDDGIGSAVDHKQPDSMGMILIKGLADQLDGKLSIDNYQGFRIAVLFQEEPVEYRPKVLV